MIYNYELGLFIERNSCEIGVGDLVMVQENQELPADMVLMSSNYPSSVAYLSTANLDGESGIKPKYGHFACLQQKENANLE